MELIQMNILKKQVDYHRQWLQSNGQRIFSRDSEYIANDLDAGGLRALQRMPSSLTNLGLYYSVKGMVRAIEGDDNGWHDLARGIDFHAWSILIKSLDFTGRNTSANENRGFTAYLPRTACLCCVSEKWSPFACKTLQSAFRAPNVIDQGYWVTREFERFVLDCCDELSGAALTNEERRSTGHFAEIWQNWDSPSDLAQTLNRTCDLHCQNIVWTNTSEWRPPFADAPFDLLPCEVMMIVRLRNKLGMDTPTIDHPLVALIAGKRHSVPTTGEDPMIEAVSDLYCSVV